VFFFLVRQPFPPRQSSLYGRDPGTTMQARTLMIFLAVVLVAGCDPGGLRRIQLQLTHPNVQNGSITVDSSETQEALQILDAVTARHGFQRIEDQAGHIRTYSFNQQQVMKDGQTTPRSIPCRAWLTSSCLEVTFGDYGFLAANPEAESLFDDVRAAFIARFGKEKVRSHRLGGASQE